MRRDFSKSIKRQAHTRAEGKCEGCGLRLRRGEGHVDHVIADGLGGEPTLENAQVLCRPCHDRKTFTRDVPAIAKTKRIQDRERGIRKQSTLRSRGFAPSKPQRSATRPIERAT
jgi:5-methylcytosine-specific restriction enzyme A